MGAFFFYNPASFSDSKIDEVKDLFTRKGFREPRIFQCGKWDLLLYQKQLFEHTNYLTNDKASIFVVGTVVYKSYGYDETIKHLLEDYCNNSVEYEKLLGNYCILFYKDDSLYWINDALNVYEVFEDTSGTFLTSSFLAASYAKDCLTIDRITAQEKLLTGYIVGENTLFNEIKRIMPQSHPHSSNWRCHTWDAISIQGYEKDRKVSIQRQAESIKHYFTNIEQLAKTYKPELGLSGGYDSRMIFAAAQDVWPFKLDVHTHSTEGVKIHDIEKEIVKDIAKKTDTHLQIVPTHNMDYYSENEIENILIDGFYFFDGRCAYNMGAFSPVYTRKYKCETMSGHGLTLNGLGGEVYRNYYMNIKPVMSTKQWMKAKVYPCAVEDILTKDKFNTIHNNICRKIDKYLPIHWGKVISNFDTRRYYSERRMPDCDALNCNAHNQMEFYLTPFIEKRIIEDAYKGKKHIGISGQYQADIINELNPLIASFSSHYGYSFDRREPLKHSIYMIIRGLLPDSLWNLRCKRITRKTKGNNANLKYFTRVREKSGFLDEAAKYTEKLFPEINFENLRLDYAMMPNSSYISITLYMLRKKIVEE